MAAGTAPSRTPPAAPNKSPVESKIEELNEVRKALLKGSFRDRLFGLGVLESVGGALHIWFRTGRLFPGLGEIPLLSTRAGPRDGEAWRQQLKAEFRALIAYTSVNKAKNIVWFRIAAANPESTRWEGTSWYVHNPTRFGIGTRVRQCFHVRCNLLHFANGSGFLQSKRVSGSRSSCIHNNCGLQIQLESIGAPCDRQCFVFATLSSHLSSTAESLSQTSTNYLY